MKRLWISFVAAALIAIAALAPATAQDDDTITVNLDEVDGSGYSGTAEITSDNEEVTVSIDLDVPEENGENGTYPAGIHDGTCEDLGDEAYELDDVENGSSESTVEVSLDELTTGEYAITVHSGDNGMEDAVACGEIIAAPVVDDDAVVDDDDDAVTDDDDDVVADDDTAVTDDAVADDDVDEVPPATGGIGGSGSETALLMITLLGAAALGAGFLVRRRALQA